MPDKLRRTKAGELLNPNRVLESEGLSRPLAEKWGISLPTPRPSFLERDVRAKLVYQIKARSEQLSHLRVFDYDPDADVFYERLKQRDELFRFLENQGLSSEQIAQAAPVISKQIEAFKAAAEPTVALPETAPELYADRPKGEKFEAWLRRVWKDPWIDAGLLSRPDLRRLDPQGYVGLQNHLRMSTLPDDLLLPKKSDLIDRQISESGIQDAREASRLQSAFYRRSP